MHTLEEKLVRDYTGLTMREVDELGVLMFWVYLRDAAIYGYSQTEQGREYLENCWRLEQTKPDRATLREKFGKH